MLTFSPDKEVRRIRNSIQQPIASEAFTAIITLFFFNMTNQQDV
jgi:hypothetical protein